MEYGLLVIGGGAAGLTAALSFAKRGGSVAILEKNERVGKKVLASGNGRCNLLGTGNLMEQYNTDAVATVFARYGLDALTAFFDELGLVLREERGRIYPYSGQSATVVNVFRKALDAYQIPVFAEDAVEMIEKKNGRFFVKTEKGTTHIGHSVLLATGSAAGFGTESLALYAPFGHRASERRPALVPLLTPTEFLRGLKGVRAEAHVTLKASHGVRAAVKDEVIFKDNGVSGSAVFTLSQVYARIGAPKSATLVFDFAPEYDEARLAKMLEEKGAEGFFHKELARNLAFYAKNANVSLANACKAFALPVKGASSKELAQVMCGGLNNEEFDFNTMESKKEKGLYAAGEALDVDGACGGYNLMWAWASGLTAGGHVPL